MTLDEGSLRDEVTRLAHGVLGRAASPDPAAMDSAERLALVVAIEDRFGVCFEPADDAGVQTLDDLVATVQRLLAAP